MNDVLGLTNNIPALLKYFIPGAICLKLFNFLRTKEENNYEYYIFKSIAISGLIVYPLKEIYDKWNDFILFTCAVVIGVLLTFIVSKIMDLDITQDILQKIHVRKTVRSFWDDVIDMEHGCYAEIKIKDDDNHYYGSVEYLEDKVGGDIYISIIDYTIKTKEGQRIEQDENVRLVFNTANVERMIFTSAKE